MKNYAFYCLLLAISLLTACETVINPTLESPVSLLTVDGFITNEPQPQTIRLTKTIGFLDNSQQPPPALGAIIKIIDNKGNEFAFIDEKKDGNYTWKPTPTLASLGDIGTSYTLTLAYEGEVFSATSKVNRVPKIDSLQYEFRKVGDFGAGTKDGYFVDLRAKDFVGIGDVYRVKAYKNDTLLSAPQQLNLVYDVSFSKGSGGDGTDFIFPIRNAVNNREKPYQKTDRCKVEILSLTEETFDFLNQVRDEQQNGGLFATPPVNVPTNVKNVNTKSTKKVVGWFCVSAMSSKSVVIK
jgi:hypothetical protein